MSADTIYGNLPETRVGTRSILKQIGGKKDAGKSIEGRKLNRKEVACYIVSHSRAMWALAQNTGMECVAKHIEKTFYTAFLETGANFDLDALNRRN